MPNHNLLRRSKIVLGLWPLSGDFGPVKLSDYEQVIKFALDNDIRTFDTAPNYGNGYSESALGVILQGEKNININTKFGSHPFGGKNFSIDSLKKSLEESLIRLKSSKLNTVFLHNPRTEISDYNKVSDFMNKLKTNNIINNSGISLAKDYEYKQINKFDSVQLDANILFLKDLEKYINKKNEIFGRSPLASGMLSGRLSHDTKFHPTDYRASWLKGQRLESVLKIISVLENKFPDFELKSLSRRFLFDNFKINKIIFGVKNKNQLEDILIDADSTELKVEILEKLNKLKNNNFNLSKDFKGF